MKRYQFSRWRGLFAFLFLSGPCAWAQSDLFIYTDRLVSGFQDWSWATRSLTNTSPVHSGGQSIQVTATVGQAIQFRHSDFSTAPFTNLTFWAHGGKNGGQRLGVSAVVGGQTLAAVTLPSLVANTWSQITLPLGSLKAAQTTNFEGVVIQLLGSGSTGGFYLDDISLTGRAAPELVHVAVDTRHPIRYVDHRWLGLNTAAWDGNLTKSYTVNLLQGLGAGILRFPGGSISDEYHWASNRSLTNTWQWSTSFHQFAPMAKAVGADVIITVNYGTGTPAEAAAWVRDANLTNHYGIRYWEVGNENYGPWETDSNSLPHDPYTYATRAHDYIQQMKAADPTIRVGVVVVDGETNYSNGYTTHGVMNPRTKKTVFGWTPVMLTRLKALGTVPDFLVYHYYPEYTFQESDPLLLQSASRWPGFAADLRQQVTDYFGSGGERIELLATENNSNAGDQGRQSTSLVNGLYLADSLGQVMGTEFNSFVWWDLRNGADTKGSFDPTLYGWRSVGDLGVLDVTINGYPTYYALKLMHQFMSWGGAGGAVLPATTDDLNLSAYAIKDGYGGVRVLTINKSPAQTITASISLTGFTPLTNASVTHYGIPQDDAARTHVGSVDLATNTFTVAAGTFSLPCPPYSIQLVALHPPAPQLTVRTGSFSTTGTADLVLGGRPGAAVELQQSADLKQWSSFQTNHLSLLYGASTNTVPIRMAGSYWRCQYRPDLP